MKTQETILEKINIATLSWFLGLLMVAVVLPHFVHNQFITGPIINASLFLAAMTVGSGNAILIGLVPSVEALVSGLLPAVLAPMVPFIMISNAILILVFSGLKKINYGFAAILASVSKYAFLYVSVVWVSRIITQKPVAAKAAAVMMQWPQLVTALMGAVIAFIILKSLKKLNENNRG